MGAGRVPAPPRPAGRPGGGGRGGGRRAGGPGAKEPRRGGDRPRAETGSDEEAARHRRARRKSTSTWRPTSTPRRPNSEEQVARMRRSRPGRCHAGPAARPEPTPAGAAAGRRGAAADGRRSRPAAPAAAGRGGGRGAGAPCGPFRPCGRRSVRALAPRQTVAQPPGSAPAEIDPSNGQVRVGPPQNATGRPPAGNPQPPPPVADIPVAGRAAGVARHGRRHCGGLLPGRQASGRGGTKLRWRDLGRNQQMHDFGGTVYGPAFLDSAGRFIVGAIRAVAWSADGRRVLVGGSDRAGRAAVSPSSSTPTRGTSSRPSAAILRPSAPSPSLWTAPKSSPAGNFPRIHGLPVKAPGNHYQEVTAILLWDVATGKE